MVIKRYPHTATIHVETSGSYVNGDYVEGVKSEEQIQGRYDPIDKKGENIRYTPNGNEIVMRGEFYTKQKPIHGAVKLSVPTKGIKERKIVFWEEYQTHSIIIV